MISILEHRKIPAADPPASEGLPVPTDLGKRHPPCRTDEACKVMTTF